MRRCRDGVETAWRSRTPHHHRWGSIRLADHCCRAARRHLSRTDNSGTSAQGAGTPGRSWTTCPELRKRRSQLPRAWRPTHASSSAEHPDMHEPRPKRHRQDIGAQRRSGARLSKGPSRCWQPADRRSAQHAAVRPDEYLCIASARRMRAHAADRAIGRWPMRPGRVGQRRLSPPSRRPRRVGHGLAAIDAAAGRRCGPGPSGASATARRAGTPGEQIKYGCQEPSRCQRLGGCDQPASGCEPHHVTHRKDGGRTSLTNLKDYCHWHHHVVLHELGWTLTVHPDGTSQVQSPDGKIIRSHSPHPAPGDHPRPEQPGTPYPGTPYPG